MKGKAISRNGISLVVDNIPGKKLPSLGVVIDGDDCMYKVATFRNEEAAMWFTEICEEFFKGLVKEE